MKTKNLLLIGGGLLAVYLLTRKKKTTTTTTTTTNTSEQPIEVVNTGRPSANITLTSTVEDAPLLPVYNEDLLDTNNFVEGIV